MKFTKKTIITLFMTSFLIAGSNLAYAAEAAAPAPAASTTGVAGIIAHLEQAKDKASRSDFSAATLDLKTARSAAGELAGNALQVHKAVNDINDGMKEVKLGHPEKAVEKIEEAIKFFKAL